jgi:deoxyribodipyrimidine photolyase-like uncharacterized protein
MFYPSDYWMERVFSLCLLAKDARVCQKNYFEAKRNLPEFYWTAETEINCLCQCVLKTKKNAYAHH